MTKRKHDRIHRPLRGECVLIIASYSEDGAVECALADKFGRQSTLRKWMREMVCAAVLGFTLDDAATLPMCTADMLVDSIAGRYAEHLKQRTRTLCSAIQRHVHPAYSVYEIGNDGMISEETDEVHLVNGGMSYVYSVVPIPDERRSFMQKRQR